MSESFWHALFNISLATSKRTEIVLSCRPRGGKALFHINEVCADLGGRQRSSILSYFMFCFWSRPLRGWYGPPIKYSCSERLDLIWFMELKKAQVTYQCEKQLKKKDFIIEDVTLTSPRSCQPFPKCNIHTHNPVLNSSILSSIHLSVSKVKRSGAKGDGGAIVVGNAGQKNGVWGKEWDRSREMGFCGNGLRQLMTQVFPQHLQQNGRLGEQYPSRFLHFLPLFFEGWQITCRSNDRRKPASNVIKLPLIQESLMKCKSKHFPEDYRIHPIN